LSIYRQSIYIDMFNKDLIRGTLKPILLGILATRDKLYGYEINKLVAEKTKDKIQLTDGALYPMLHKLEKDGLVTTELVSVGNRMRKYYKLTDKGKVESSERTNELVEFMKTISTLISHQNTEYGTAN